MKKFILAVALCVSLICVSEANAFVLFPRLQPKPAQVYVLPVPVAPQPQVLPPLFIPVAPVQWQYYWPVTPAPVLPKTTIIYISR